MQGIKKKKNKEKKDHIKHTFYFTRIAIYFEDPETQGYIIVSKLARLKSWI